MINDSATSIFFNTCKCILGQSSSTKPSIKILMEVPLASFAGWKNDIFKNRQMCFFCSKFQFLLTKVLLIIAKQFCQLFILQPKGLYLCNCLSVLEAGGFEHSSLGSRVSCHWATKLMTFRKFYYSKEQLCNNNFCHKVIKILTFNNISTILP